MLRVDRALGLWLCAIVTTLSLHAIGYAQGVNGRQLIIDDNAADGIRNTLTIQAPAVLPLNATLNIPNPGTATANFILTESVTPQTINATLNFTGVIDFSGATVDGGTVQTDASLLGDGSSGDLLRLNLGNSNTWTVLQNFSAITAAGTITGGTLTDGTASLTGGTLDLGAGANDDLTAADVTDLTDGGTTTLHDHDSRYFTETELGSTAAGQGASLIGVEDAGGNFTATTVEGVLAELASTSSGASTGEAFITAAASGSLSAERVLAGGTGVTVTDGGANGNMTVSIGQSVATSASPTFDGLSLGNLTSGSTATDVVVSNGGTLETRRVNSLVGASTLTEDNIWIGNASNNPSELAPGTNGQVLQINGTTPSWETVNLLPAGTTDNAALIWDAGSNAWVENAMVTLDAANGDITTSGDLTVGELNTSNEATIGGDLTVSGAQVNLPNGSIGNAELANSSVSLSYGTGVTGDASVSLGGTLNLQNTGVTTLSGTANQVSASASTGAVTLSLPQSIHTGATPSFAGLNLTGNLGITTGNISISTAGNISTTSGNISTTSGSITTSSGNLVAGNGGELRLTESGGSDYSAFKAGTQSGNITYTLPTTNGSAGQLLRIASSPAPTATTATLEWASASGSSGFGSVGGIVFARKTANEDVTSSTTLQNDDHLTVALNANESYELDGVLFASTTDNGHDLQIALTVPTGTTMRVSYHGTEENTTNNRETDVLTASGTAGTVVNLQSANGVVVRLKGLIRTAGTSGNVTLQWADDSSAGSETVTLGTDSFFKVTRVQ